MRRISLLLPLLPVLAACSEYDIILWDGVDTWTQNPPESVDILLVVDNSGSMEPYQKELGDNFESFLTYFLEADVDYQIGAVTTDVTTSEAGMLVADIITPSTEDANSKFTEMVNVGTSGSGNEMGLEGAYLALTEPNISSANAGFLREDASLSILFVSDEEDSSPRPVNDYINDFFEIKGQRDRDVFNASALTVVDLQACDALEAAYSTINTRYVDVAEQTDGVVGDICEEDFSNIVTELSLNASRLLDTFYLSASPDAASLEISVNEEVIPCDNGSWTYDLIEEDSVTDTGLATDTGGEGSGDRPALVFAEDQIPPADSTIVARYDYGDGDPSTFCTATDDTGARK